MKQRTRRHWILLVCLVACSMAFPIGASAIEPDVKKQRFRDLTTHEQLKNKLLRIQRRARNTIQVGPLIKNQDNGGLINIDVDLVLGPSTKPDACGPENVQPTVREAVICTINDGGRGNQVPSKIGLSTQGRELWSARLGNKHGMKVLFITQQHGNEVRSTEAALQVIEYLSRTRHTFHKSLLEKLDILFLVRANPDGGEPSPECFIGTPFGTVIQENCALTRTNVDPQAGGGYGEDSESDFFGTVGVGYNLNRYHYVDLKHQIRPQENQAMVATALAWRPEVVFDLHGDIHKTACGIDPTSITPGALVSGLPSAQCQAGSDESAVVLSPIVSMLNEDGGLQQRRSRTLAARIAHKVSQSGFGLVNRFAQINTGAGAINEGGAGAYAKVGAVVGGWESLNFTNAVSLSIQRIVDGMPVPGLTPEWFMGNTRFRFVNTLMNAVAIMEGLKVVSEWTSTEPGDEGGYCDLPLTTAIKVAFPEDVFGPQPGYGPFILPLIGSLLQVLDSCSTNP
ncbi:MAG: hypothetical protein NPIRA01_24360 [Nitrospirales bacterium]|nr:MAG: hypothetical protein NPIRA01_24360 [Nitrospirales bacterium]